MEQHPVPQNITSFEFRLIGDMTLRQFGLLTAGIATAYIFWQLPLPDLIRLPITGLLAFLGVAFAFLPLDNRPLHRWLIAFLKSIYSPTQFLFQKSEEAPYYLRPGFPYIAPKMAPAFQVAESRQKLEEYLKTLPKSLPTTLDIKEEESLKKIQGLLGTVTALPLHHPARLPPRPPIPSLLKLKRKPSPSLAPSPIPEEKPQPLPRRRLAFTEGGRLIFEEEKKTVPTISLSQGRVATTADLLVEEIKKLKEAIATMRAKQPSQKAPTREIATYEEKLAELEKQLEAAEEERENMMHKMLEMQKQMAGKPRGVTPTEVLEKTQNVKIVSAETAKAAGMPRLTNIPNVVTGIVQDKKGIFLPNILVEIKDKGGNSVRAFKTNKLGQFAAATPLGNGSYTLELEDPRHEFIFDIIEVKVDGSVLLPLAIYAKGQGELEREKIRESLFGNN